MTSINEIPDEYERYFVPLIKLMEKSLDDEISAKSIAHLCFKVKDRYEAAQQEYIDEWQKLNPDKSGSFSDFPGLCGFVLSAIYRRTFGQNLHPQNDLLIRFWSAFKAFETLDALGDVSDLFYCDDDCYSGLNTYHLFHREAIELMDEAVKIYKTSNGGAL